MTDYNIYAEYNFNYNFSSGTAYVSKEGFVDVIDPETIFEYPCNNIILASSMILYSFGMTDTAEIHLQCLDENDTVIPGSETFSGMDGPSLKSTYTFSEPLVVGSKIRYVVTSPSFTSTNTTIDFCNITITI